MTHSDAVFWGHLPGSAIFTVFSGCVVEIASEISQDSSQTRLDTTEQGNMVSPLGIWLPALGLHTSST